MTPEIGINNIKDIFRGGAKHWRVLFKKIKWKNPQK